MTLSSAYEATYEQLLAVLSRHCEALPPDVCLHWPMHQPSYTGRLLAIGQAPNGWLVDTPACDLRTEARRRELLAETRGFSEAERAFDWMRLRVRTRPFWKLVDVAMEALGLTLDQIAWSNLAKAAPDGGNPTGVLLTSQLELAGRLLRREVEELEPEIVLVISGRGYTEPFMTTAGYNVGWVRRGACQFDGMLDGRRWVVVSHPGTFAYRFEASRLAVVEALSRS